MITNDDKPAFVPVFKKCVRCGYSLRGLPTNHACPECGLRFDERCELYRVTNPKQVLAVWLMILGGGWVSLKNLPHFADLAGASAWETVGALAGALWVVFVAAGIWFFIRRYRRGFEVAITSDGLILRLPGFSDDLMPWSDIDGASIKERPAGKPQVAAVFLRSKNKTVEIGGVPSSIRKLHRKRGGPPVMASPKSLPNSSGCTSKALFPTMNSRRRSRSS